MSAERLVTKNGESEVDMSFVYVHFDGPGCGAAFSTTSQFSVMFECAALVRSLFDLNGARIC